MPATQRAPWDRSRDLKERGERSQRFRLADRESETYLRQNAVCAPFPSAWETQPGATNRCRQCTTPAPPLPRCTKQDAARGGPARSFGPSLLELPTTEVITVHARLKPGGAWGVGTAHEVSLSSALLLTNPKLEGFALYLQLATEGLTSPLKQLPEGPWISSSGTLYCSGSEERCCPFDFGHAGELTDVRVTGRLLEARSFYPDHRDEAQGAFLAQSICRL